MGGFEKRPSSTVIIMSKKKKLSFVLYWPLYFEFFIHSTNHTSSEYPSYPPICKAYFGQLIATAVSRNVIDTKTTLLAPYWNTHKISAKARECAYY